MNVIRNFEDAQAAGMCWMYTNRGRMPAALDYEGIHPGPCPYCLWTQADKIAALEAYNDSPGQASQRRSFFLLPAETRLRRMRDAQTIPEAVR